MIQELKQTNPGRKHTLEFFDYMIQVMANHGRYIQEGILRSWYCSTAQYTCDNSNNPGYGHWPVPLIKSFFYPTKKKILLNYIFKTRFLAYCRFLSCRQKRCGSWFPSFSAIKTKYVVHKRLRGCSVWVKRGVRVVGYVLTSSKWI